MPVHIGRDQKGHYMQYGKTGRKYYFKPSIASSFNRAHDLAHKQQAAIWARRYNKLIN